MGETRAREDAIRKVAALMARTTANGCTEAEATTAADLAARIMNAHHLSLSDIKIKDEGCEVGSVQTGRKDGGHMFYLISAIAFFTDTKCWRSVGPAPFYNAIHRFFGLKTDVIVATYVYAVLDGAIWRAWENHRIHDIPGYPALSAKQKNAVKNGFMAGIVSRLDHRLREMKEDRVRENVATTGRDLVPLKGQIVSEEFAKLNLRLSTAKGSGPKDINPASFHAGRKAADRIQIVKGIE